MVFIEKFEKGKKKLVLIGVSHSNDSEQINKIKREIEKFNPDVILIEGEFEKAKFSSESEAILHGWEMGFVSYFARKRNILLEPNDPSDEECIKFIGKIY